ncbi:MAG TPA: hypothetical protein VMT16_14265, partial [Thermoanaerobaculia bacterium]|nr:hypothetical protein [Thermoanaerobaculia bacterium]
MSGRPSRRRSAWRRLRGLLELALAETLTLALQLLPWRGVQAIGRWLGRLGWRVAGRERRRTLAHLELAFPDATAAGREHLGRRCFEHFGTTLAECLWMRRRHCEALLRHVQVDGLADTLRAPRPFLLLTGHCGNWELLAATMGCAGL